MDPLQIMIALGALAALFILFLVISKTLNSTINYLTKIEYLLRRDIELKQEDLAVVREAAKKSERERRRSLDDD